VLIVSGLIAAAEQTQLFLNGLLLLLQLLQLRHHGLLVRVLVLGLHDLLGRPNLYLSELSPRDVHQAEFCIDFSLQGSG
jgi:hypothetical protein